MIFKAITVQQFKWQLRNDPINGLTYLELAQGSCRYLLIGLF